jgi:hypothetical protein
MIKSAWLEPRKNLDELQDNRYFKLTVGLRIKIDWGKIINRLENDGSIRKKFIRSADLS